MGRKELVQEYHSYDPKAPKVKGQIDYFVIAIVVLTLAIFWYLTGD